MVSFLPGWLGRLMTSLSVVMSCLVVEQKKKQALPSLLLFPLLLLHRRRQLSSFGTLFLASCRTPPRTDRQTERHN
ncbi:hypothetical protein IWZ03DRAFT_368355 [Phyllosticta citriasiana]|uniref:Secreted protein n=1 Tax=Phyllosticta citriasiana TaxID=595635 RepID=A0ABR1L3M3_9PEZI